ncbi:MAG: histidine--tRNA ligase [Eubacteriales bacterium]|jgi:histidyl-tRNA synthetase
MIQRPRGTRDVLPGESYKWHYIEEVVRQLCQDFNFKEVRFPTFEETQLFRRGVGDTTDVVQKEMYDLAPKGEREASLTLRPEGTASTVRMFLENGLYGGALPAKYYYLIPCFRYEKPQAGRLREFHQFGVEVFGTPHPQADAEVISIARELLSRLGVTGLELNLNSIGCPTCRKAYNEALREYFRPHLDTLCETCRGRFERNPMRIIDCKSPVCQEIAKDAPRILDYICEDCRAHFEKVQEYLTAMDIPFRIDPNIVRGLDYYTKTVFEFVSTDIGAQGTVCGGGRYDGLVEQLGERSVPGLGFALGIERLILQMEAQGLSFGQEPGPKIFLANWGAETVPTCLSLVQQLRRQGIAAECDLMGKSVKAQMKYADKIGAAYTMVIGGSELASGEGRLKHMASGEETVCRLDQLGEHLRNA